MELSSGANVVNLLHNLAEFAPTMLKKGQSQFDFTPLCFWLGPSLATELLSVLNEVRQELVPKHAERPGRRQCVLGRISLRSSRESQILP